MKHLTKILLVFLLLCALRYPLNAANAAVPHLINYQGRLTDTSGSPLNGSYALTFRIYDAETAGNLLWEENQTGVLVQKGIFNILLGSVTNLNLTFDKPYFLEIKVGGEVMAPRQRMTSAGYAIMAEEAKIRADSADPNVGYLIDKVDNSSIKVDPATHKMCAALPSRSQFFTSSGTWTCPAGVTTVYLTMVGGGGGGGNYSSMFGAGAGGGGGGTIIKFRHTVTPSFNYTVVIGQGGTAQSAGAASSFDTTIIAAGGNGANKVTIGTGGGTLNGASDPNNPIGGPTGITGGNGGAFNGSSGGGGGGSVIGRGGTGGILPNSGGAAPANSGGGGGGSSGQSGGIGGAGGSGFVLLEW